MKEDHRPIGIIDSGIGGFSVVRTLQAHLPHENILYLGDGANTPYGNHSSQAIFQMTQHMLQWMEMAQVKVLLIACNTISCLLEACRPLISCPVLGILQAGAKAIAQLPFQRIGVLSTCFTHRSGAYPRLISEYAPEKQVFSQGCVHLAQRIETSLDDPIAQCEIEGELTYHLDLLRQRAIECCVLGCTHYPLIQPQIQALAPNLPLIDPAQALAQTVSSYLQTHHLLHPQGESGHLKLYTTGDPAVYGQMARQMGLFHIQSVESAPPFSL